MFKHKEEVLEIGGWRIKELKLQESMSQNVYMIEKMILLNNYSKRVVPVLCI